MSFPPVIVSYGGICGAIHILRPALLSFQDGCIWNVREWKRCETCESDPSIDIQHSSPNMIVLTASWWLVTWSSFLLDIQTLTNKVSDAEVRRPTVLEIFNHTNWGFVNIGLFFRYLGVVKCCPRPWRRCKPYSHKLNDRNRKKRFKAWIHYTWSVNVKRKVV